MNESPPALGVGLGFRAAHFSELFLHRGEIDFLEITADHFFGDEPENDSRLALLAEHFPLIPHGLNLSLGSADGLDPAYLERFAAIVERVHPPWWSEHLAFTRAGGIEIGHLTPLPFTREAIAVACRNIAEARRRIPGALILENITCTLRLPGAEMSEGEFLRQITRETDCGLLLDVTNLFINAANHGFDPRRWLDQAPLERVVQLHFVGAQRDGDQWIDSHAQPVGPDLWALIDEVLARTPARGAILERDEHIPPLAELQPEIQTARAMGRRHGRWA